MRRLLTGALLVVSVTLAALQPDAAAAAGSKTLLWRQEFGGKVGTKLDSKTWGYDLGNLNANSEEQYYTNSKWNVALDGKGHLLITARRIKIGRAHV